MNHIDCNTNLRRRCLSRPLSHKRDRPSELADRRLQASPSLRSYLTPLAPFAFQVRSPDWRLSVIARESSPYLLSIDARYSAGFSR